jgi:hypothetical protein
LTAFRRRANFRPAWVVRKWNGEGLALIARWLRTDRVRIF